MRKAFTLIEVMVVICCMLLVCGPVYEILKSGTTTSLKGMLQVGTTLEARRVLKQVNSDLKQGCWVWNDKRNGVYYITDICEGNKEEMSWSMLSFPAKGSIDDAIPDKPEESDGPYLRKFPRRVSRITYTLELLKDKSIANIPLYKLWRNEQFNPKHPMAKEFPNGWKHALSERVLEFNIKPFQHDLVETKTSQQSFFWITLKLADTWKPPQDTKVSGNQLQGPSKDVVIASFFDVVSPEFYSGYRSMAGPSIEDEGYYQRNTFPDPIDPSRQNN